MTKAAYNGETLAIRDMSVLKGSFGLWKPSLANELKKHEKAGFDVYIEDISDHFSEYGRVYSLDTIDLDHRRAYQNIALDYYTAMSRAGEANSGNKRGTISVKKEYMRYFIQSGMLNVLQDDKGRNRYEVDIEQGGFSGYTRTILMCVLAASFFNEISENYIDRFMGLIGEKPEYTPADRMFDIFRKAEARGSNSHG